MVNVVAVFVVLYRTLSVVLIIIIRVVLILNLLHSIDSHGVEAWEWVGIHPLPEKERNWVISFPPLNNYNERKI